MSNQIHQEVVVEGPPARVYRILTDSNEFSTMTGGVPTEIEAEAGGAFSCFGGMITGRTIECTEGQSLIQAWRAKTWDPGVYSIVRFELRPEGDGTRVVLDHKSFPEGQSEHLENGWHQNYWEPLKRHLDST